jgi:hypothetical protein
MIHSGIPEGFARIPGAEHPGCIDTAKLQSIQFAGGQKPMTSKKKANSRTLWVRAVCIALVALMVVGSLGALIFNLL